MSVITTKFLGPTNSRGSRIKATSDGGISVTVPWDWSKDSDGNHDGAAWALVEKLCWNDSGRMRIVRGRGRDGNVYIPFYGESSFLEERS